MFEGKKYIYEVYRTRSFSKAAENLYISQPSLSMMVKKEEARIGSPLFDRSTTPITLTDVGVQYIACIERINEVEHDFDSYRKDIGELSAGSLAIGGSNLFVSYILPRLLQRFHARWPAIDFHLIEASTQELEKHLRDGSVDFIIDNFDFSDRLYHKYFFQKEELLLAVPSSFPVVQQLSSQAFTADDIRADRCRRPEAKPVSLAAFAEVPFLLLRTGNDTRLRSDAMFRQAGITPVIQLELDQQATAYHIACSGMGACFTSDTLVKNASADPGILFFRLDPALAGRNIYFYCSRSKYVTKVMQEFLKTVQQDTGAGV